LTQANDFLAFFFPGFFLSTLRLSPLLNLAIVVLHC
jgi:hypothetical protein